MCILPTDTVANLRPIPHPSLSPFPRSFSPSLACSLPQERNRLRETVSSLRGEVLQLQTELEAGQAALQLAQRETQDARGLWEMELKSRATLGLKVKRD